MNYRVFAILLLVLLSLCAAGFNGGEFDYSELHPYLYDITLLVPDVNYFIVGDGSNWIRKTGSTVRDSLGLGTSYTPIFAGATIGSLTGILRGDTGVMSVDSELTGWLPNVVLGPDGDLTLRQAGSFAFGDNVWTILDGGDTYMNADKIRDGSFNIIPTGTQETNWDAAVVTTDEIVAVGDLEFLFQFAGVTGKTRAATLAALSGQGTAAFNWNAQNLTNIAIATAEHLTSTDDITMQGHLLTLGNDSATDIVIDFKASANDGKITFDESLPQFNINVDGTIELRIGKISVFGDGTEIVHLGSNSANFVGFENIIMRSNTDAEIRWYKDDTFGFIGMKFTDADNKFTFFDLALAGSVVFDLPVVFDDTATFNASPVTLPDTVFDGVEPGGTTGIAAGKVIDATGGTGGKGAAVDAGIGGGYEFDGGKGGDYQSVGQPTTIVGGKGGTITIRSGVGGGDDGSFAGNADGGDSGDINLIIAAPGAGYGAGSSGATGRITIGDGGTTDYIENSATGDMVFVGSAGLVYANMYVLDNGAATVISIAGKANKVQVIIFGVDGPSNNMAPDHTQDHITVTKAGHYMASVSITVSGAGGDVDNFGLSLWKNDGGVEFANVHGHRNLAGGAGDIGSIHLSGIVDLAVDDTIEVWVWNEDDTDNLTVDDISLTLIQVGGT